MSSMKSLQGTLLIASSRLMDPNFVRTVILLVQHGEDGALGLVINRPLETTIAEVCTRRFPARAFWTAPSSRAAHATAR